MAAVLRLAAITPMLWSSLVLALSCVASCVVGLEGDGSLLIVWAPDIQKKEQTKAIAALRLVSVVAGGLAAAAAAAKQTKRLKEQEKVSSCQPLCPSVTEEVRLQARVNAAAKAASDLIIQRAELAAAKLAQALHLQRRAQELASVRTPSVMLQEVAV